MNLLQLLGLPPLPTETAKAPDRLSLGASGWLQIHRQASQRIAALKGAIKGHYADQHPELLQEIDKGVTNLDAILDNVDHRLAEVMANAGKAADDSARKAELKNAKALLTQYITYIKSEPLIAHMDQNPFGVKTDLRALLAAGLTDAAKAIS